MEILDSFYEVSLKLLREITLTKKRYLYEEIDWDQRLISITGMRGVGKTTLVMQYLKENFSIDEKVLYVLADNVLLHKTGLLKLAQEFEKNGGKVLFIDEIHKYPNWNQEVKNIYDTLPNLKVIISGSSSIDIVKGYYDLSRRVVSYNLQGMSFREFINFSYDLDFDIYTINEILKSGRQISIEILDKIEKQNSKVLPLFHRYLKYGYYPYILEGEKSYYKKLNNAISKVVYEDIPLTYKLSSEAVFYLNKIIALVATSTPLIPNIASIASALEISKDTTYLYLEYLNNAGVLNFLNPHDKGERYIRKPAKIYLENSNLYFAITQKDRVESDIGSIRETFVYNQLSKNEIVNEAGEYGDFLINKKYLLEVGGKSKQSKQLKSVDSDQKYVIKDGIEVGDKKFIPLWMFGLLY